MSYTIKEQLEALREILKKLPDSKLKDQLNDLGSTAAAAAAYEAADKLESSLSTFMLVDRRDRDLGLIKTNAPDIRELFTSYWRDNKSDYIEEFIEIIREKGFYAERLLMTYIFPL